MTSFWSWVKVELMKKLLMIMGLSLLFSGSVHAKDVYLLCYADNGMPDISIVINDDTQTIIIDGNKITFTQCFYTIYFNNSFINI